MFQSMHDLNRVFLGRTGRVGNVGKATSFYDPEQDGDVAGKLVTMLANAGVAVPDWLEEAGAGGDDEDEEWG